MPLATLTFSAPINASCQVGDIVYYVTTDALGGFQKNSASVVKIGDIRQITNPTSTSPTIVAFYEDMSSATLTGLSNPFILFSKNNIANMSSPLGYFASVKMVNDDTVSDGELYCVAVDMFESSK